MIFLLAPLLENTLGFLFVSPTPFFFSFSFFYLFSVSFLFPPLLSPPLLLKSKKTKRRKIMDTYKRMGFKKQRRASLQEANPSRTIALQEPISPVLLAKMIAPSLPPKAPAIDDPPTDSPQTPSLSSPIKSPQSPPRLPEEIIDELSPGRIAPSSSAPAKQKSQIRPSSTHSPSTSQHLISSPSPPGLPRFLKSPRKAKKEGEEPKKKEKRNSLRNSLGSLKISPLPPSPTLKIPPSAATFSHTSSNNHLSPSSPAPHPPPQRSTPPMTMPPPAISPSRGSSSSLLGSPSPPPYKSSPLGSPPPHPTSSPPPRPVRTVSPLPLPPSSPLASGGSPPIRGRHNSLNTTKGPYPHPRCHSVSPSLCRGRERPLGPSPLSPPRPPRTSSPLGRVTLDLGAVRRESEEREKERERGQRERVGSPVQSPPRPFLGTGKEQTSGFFRYVHVVKSAESLNPTARRSLGAGPSLSRLGTSSVYEGQLNFTESKEDSNKPELRGGTFAAIVRYIILSSSSQKHAEFLICYRKFADPNDLLAEIQKVFHEIIHHDMSFFASLRTSVVAGTEEGSEDLKNQNLLRFGNFCKKWLSDFTLDFGNQDRYETFVEFLNGTLLPIAPRIHSVLLSALARASKKGEEEGGERNDTKEPKDNGRGGVQTPRPFVRGRSGSFDYGLGSGSEGLLIGVPPPSPRVMVSEGEGEGKLEVVSSPKKEPSFSRRNRLTKVFNRTSDEFLNCTSTQLARELTMHDSQLFCGMKWWEIVDMSCWKEENMGKNSNISHLVSYFNRVGSVISTHVLSFPKSDLRAKAVGLWYKVGCKCLDLNNYNGAMIVFSGLNQSAILRLKQTFSLLTEEDKRRRDRMEELLAPHGGFVKLKNAVALSVPPCIPYMGLYSSDLAYILDGLPSKLENGFINYQKYQICASLVLQVRLFQNIKYNFDREPAVAEIFERAEWFTEEQLYEISLQRESRRNTKS